MNRPNLMVKIPATAEGIPAIEQAISEGININVTLLFAQDRYESVAHAYIVYHKNGYASGGDVGRVASVASFFISRIDSLIDARIKAKLKETGDPQQQDRLRGLLGKVAIANGKLWITSFTRRSFPAPIGSRWPRREGKRSAFCGPRPAPRIRAIPTYFILTN